MRTPLTGEAKEVSQLANKYYEELRKALVDRFGRRPHQYFADLLEVKRGENETYRGLMAKIQQSVNRFVGDEDPKVRLCEKMSNLQVAGCGLKFRCTHDCDHII